MREPTCSTSSSIYQESRTMEEKNETDNMPSKKQRKANWTNKEIWILLEEVRLEKEYLMSSLTNEITNKKKSAIWQRIADKIAASCGVEHRSLVSVREKWGTLKSEAQRRRDKRKATGGGAVKECEYDNTIFDILGEGSNIADGIDGGIDMFSLRTTPSCSDMPSETVTSDSPTCVRTDQLSQEDIPSTSATEKSVELVEEEVADSSLGMASKEANRGKRKLLRKAAFGGPLVDDYLKSEIKKNESIIELNESNLELNKLRKEILQKALVKIDDISHGDIFDRVTYV